MSQVVNEVCEALDITLPEIPPRSRLTCLEPAGIGTAFVESLTSYLTRLAAAHSVAVESLFGIELVPLVNRPYLNPLTKHPRLMFAFHRTAHSLNGKGGIAEDCSAALERLTLRNDLRFLTLIKWRHLLSHVGLLRKKKAWCPNCYKEQIESNGPVYDHLLWALQEVTICPRHFVELESECPFCSKQSQPFTRKMQAGVCNSCGGWLGFVRETSVNDEIGLGAKLRERVKTVMLIGEMLAVTPFLEQVPSKEQLTSSLRKYTNQFPAHNWDIIAKLMKTTPKTMSGLMNGEYKVRLGVLVRICRAFDSSVLNFINGCASGTPTLFNYIQHLCIEKKNEIISSKIEKKNRVIRHLEAALNSPNYLSLNELSRQLGYKSPKSLRIIAAELCEKISARNKEIRPKIGPKNSFIPDHVRIVLVRALCEEPPPTVKDVSLRLGITDELRFRSRYSDVAKLLMQRRKEYIRGQYLIIEEALLAALQEEPPPSLKEVCERITYKGKPFKWVQSLDCKFPAHCRAIRTRYRTYKITGAPVL